MLDADLLILLQNKVSNNSKGRIPMKFFEYLSTSNPILILGEKQSDLANLASIIPGCFVAEYLDKSEIKTALLEAYKNYRAQHLVDRKEETKMYTRKHVALKLDRLIQQLS
jgi:hypothetical protein